MASFVRDEFLLTSLSIVRTIHLAVAWRKENPQDTEFSEYYAQIQHINNDKLKEIIPIIGTSYIPEQERKYKVKTQDHYQRIAFLKVSH